MDAQSEDAAVPSPVCRSLTCPLWGAFSLTAELVMEPLKASLTPARGGECADACTGLKKMADPGRHRLGCTASVFLKPCPPPLRQQIQGLVTSSLLPAWASALTTLSGLVHSPGAARHKAGGGGPSTPPPSCCPARRLGEESCVSVETQLKCVFPFRVLVWRTTFVHGCVLFLPHGRACAIHTTRPTRSPPQVRVLACV